MLIFVVYIHLLFRLSVLYTGRPSKEPIGCVVPSNQIRFNYILIHTKRSYIDATRHVPWAQNITEMPLRTQGRKPTALSMPLSWIYGVVWQRRGEENGKWEVKEKSHLLLGHSSQNPTSATDASLST